jgi:hypothetical protein
MTLKESIFKLNNFSNKNKSMKNLRKLVPFIIALVAIITFSCTTDYTNPNNLKGTTWRRTSFPEGNNEVEYVDLKFITTTAVEGWTKLKEESAVRKVDINVTYTVSKSTITFTQSYTDEGQTKTDYFTGIIKGKTITISEGDATEVFTKQ